MVIAALLVFFPIMINVLRGLTQVDPSALELMRCYAADERQVLRKVRIPNALPYFFTGAEGRRHARLIGAIVGEFFGGPNDALGRVVVESASGCASTSRGPRSWSGRDRDRDVPVVPASSGSSSRGTHRSRGASLSAATAPSRRLDAHRVDSPVVGPERTAGARRRSRSRMRRELHASRRRFAGAGVAAAALFGACSERGGRRAAADANRSGCSCSGSPQAQFAGYFAADRQGYYRTRASTVNVLPGGPTSPQQVGSEADGPEFTISWVPKVLQARASEAGSDLVNIAQIFQRAGTLVGVVEGQHIT